MANPTSGGYQPAAQSPVRPAPPRGGSGVPNRQSSDQVFEAILLELRAIRAAIEKPRQTAERENAEFLAGLKA